MQGHARGHEGREHVGGHMFVIERDDVTLGGEREHGGDVAVVADRGVPHDLRSRGILALGEHAQGEAEFRRRAGAHPRELAAADDANDGEAPGGTQRLTHGREDTRLRRGAPVKVSP